MLCCSAAQLCPALCDPTDCSLSGSSVHGIFQARILEWVAISYSSRCAQGFAFYFPYNFVYFQAFNDESLYKEINCWQYFVRSFGNLLCLGLKVLCLRVCESQMGQLGQQLKALFLNIAAGRKKQNQWEDSVVTSSATVSSIPWILVSSASRDERRQSGRGWSSRSHSPEPRFPCPSPYPQQKANTLPQMHPPSFKAKSSCDVASVPCWCGKRYVYFTLESDIC